MFEQREKTEADDDRNRPWTIKLLGNLSISLLCCRLHHSYLFS
jgi:hypothetical protein